MLGYSLSQQFLAIYRVNNNTQATIFVLMFNEDIQYSPFFREEGALPYTACVNFLDILPLSLSALFITSLG